MFAMLLFVVLSPVDFVTVASCDFGNRNEHSAKICL